MKSGQHSQKFDPFFVNPVPAFSLKSCKTCSMKCSYRFEFLSEHFVSSTFSTDWITGLKIDYIEILKLTRKL